jgi:hypothetical protein
MKVREMFVSNSSSSSFILPFKTENDEAVLKFSVKDVLEMFSRGGLSDADTVLSTEEDVRAYIVGRYGWGGQTFETLMNDVSEPWVREKYNQIMSHINDGKSVVTGSMDNGEYLAAEMIRRLGGEGDE